MALVINTAAQPSHDWALRDPYTDFDINATGTLLTVVNFVKSMRHGKPAGDDPWKGDSLEWMTTSPPPEYNFAAIPAVGSRHPLWDQHPVPVASSADDSAPARYDTRKAPTPAFGLTVVRYREL